MAKVFIDTAAWLALLNKSDSYHALARQTFATLQKNKSRFVTSEFVLLEVADALAHPNFRIHIRPFIA
jgi:predicted nucleic acid-binding protein